MSIQKAKSYLRLFRAHTVPLEAVPAAAGALLATGGEVTPGVVLWGVFGIIYHMAGYGMNSYSDWKNGYDKDDDNKSHHPLNKGSLSKKEARVAVGVAMTAALSMAATLSYPNLPALGSLGVALVAGVAYNEMGKETPYKFILISLAHMNVFVAPYLAMGGDPLSVTFNISAAVVYLWVMFQISVSGEVKDMTSGEENFLKTMGATCEEDGGDSYFFAPVRVVGYSVGLRVVIGAMAVLMYLVQGGGSVVGVLAISSLAIIGTAFAVDLLKPGVYARQKRIDTMSVIEMVTLYMFVVALYPSVGFYPSALLLTGSTAWVFAFNKVLWGTLVGPRV